MSDDLAAVDALREDMALHQRAHVGEVTDSKNHAMAAGVFERLDRKESEDRPAAPLPPVALPVKHGVSTEIKEGEHGSYRLTSSPVDDAKFRPASAFEHWFMTHAMPRVNLLLTKTETGPLGQPSWAQRTYAVMELQSRVAGLRARGLHQSADDVTRRFSFELVELLDASNATFGNWKSDPDPRISVTVT
jgi:hypothetical protein